MKTITWPCLSKTLRHGRRYGGERIIMSVEQMEFEFHETPEKSEDVRKESEAEPNEDEVDAGDGELSVEEMDAFIDMAREGMDEGDNPDDRIATWGFDLNYVRFNNGFPFYPDLAPTLLAAGGACVAIVAEIDPGKTTSKKEGSQVKEQDGSQSAGEGGGNASPDSSEKAQ